MTLKKRLQQAVKSIHVDPFGIEDKARKRIKEYLVSAAIQARTSTTNVQLKIVKRAETISVCLHKDAGNFFLVTIDTLVSFFTPPGVASHASIKAKAINKLQRFLTKLSKQFKIPVEEITLDIRLENDEVKVFCFRENQLVQELSLRKLIKHFRQ